MLEFCDKIQLPSVRASSQEEDRGSEQCAEPCIPAQGPTNPWHSELSRWHLIIHSVIIRKGVWGARKKEKGETAKTGQAQVSCEAALEMTKERDLVFKVSLWSCTWAWRALTSEGRVDSHATHLAGSPHT